MNRPGLHRILFALVTGLLFLFQFSVVDAAEEYTGRTYKQKIIKSRADRGYSNRGKVLYKYSEVGEYSDDLDDEKIGNLKVDSGVREVHNVTIIHGDVKSKKQDLEVGHLNFKKSRQVTDVNNEVVIGGDVDASGESMEIGTVRLGSDGNSKNINNSVTIRGDVDGH